MLALVKKGESEGRREGGQDDKLNYMLLLESEKTTRYRFFF